MSVRAADLSRSVFQQESATVSQRKQELAAKRKASRKRACAHQIELEKFERARRVRDLRKLAKLPSPREVLHAVEESMRRAPAMDGAEVARMRLRAWCDWRHV